MTRGTNDTLVIETDPPGADVKLSNGMVGKTPATFKLPRKDSLVVDLHKVGYEAVKVNVRPQISGAGGAGMAGNVLLGGIIGVAVDAGTGAMNDLKPNPIHVRLSRLDDDLGEASVDGVEQRMATLKTMRQSGLLTEAEYRRKRTALLSRL
ncbi:SHOCT domain-containing protein [Thiocystis violascens]|uniref:PEGA domain-containing protein n=1 Tax=Thiocystis violascens (strain ATCC 17096 / DSM 198 / 6111) TaxID=765911 RepID=I3YH36_THIV6|nr:SHOCT domain-containing protein [Thiocystis violascens]AFL76304.1 PEGA domain-containing protein [Thiocystis violascens DSM 198]